MVEDIERIDRIVGQFVEFARAGQPPRFEAIDVADLLDQLPAAYRQQSGEPLVELEVVSPRGLRWHGDPVDLQRAIGNLIDNAMRYGRGPGQPIARVSVSARRSAGGIELRVEDEGPGLPEASLVELLRPFSRLDRARGGNEGSGLGLAIVDRLARRYGGRLELRNRPTGGLTAIVQLPDQRRRGMRAESNAGTDPAGPRGIDAGNREHT